MEDQPHGTRRKQSRFRPLHSFSLRTLLILTTIIAVWLAWWSHTARQQREAVAAIKATEGAVYYDFDIDRIENRPPRGSRWLADAIGIDYVADVLVAKFSPQTTEADLERLAWLPRLRVLDLGRTRISDDGLKNLRHLTTLEELSLRDTKTSDAGLANLYGLRALQSLALDDTTVTDTGLVYLEDMHSLKKLGLESTQVTDAGLKHLEGLTQLTELNLSNTKITDAGLNPLKGLTSLQLLDLRNTNVPVAGVERLQRALPNCTIHR